MPVSRQTLTPERAAAIGRIGGLVTRSRHDGREHTEPARAAFLDSFAKQVDPEGVLPEAERLRRAEAARSAHFARLALLSAESRRAKKASRS